MEHIFRLLQKRDQILPSTIIEAVFGIGKLPPIIFVLCGVAPRRYHVQPGQSFYNSLNAEEEAG